MKYRIKHVVEYGLLRAVDLLVRWLPERAALATGWVLAAVAFHLVRFRRAEAERRIAQVFGSRYSRREITRIAAHALRNLFFNAIELMRLGRMGPDWLARHLDHGGLPEQVARHAPDTGAIVVVPHMGNWDLAGVAARQLGLPIFAIAARQKNPLVDAWLNRRRSFTGVEMVERDVGAARKVIRHLRAGHVLAFMTDLRSRTPALRIRFLGQEANVVGGLGLFARQTGVPIIPVLIYRDGWTHHRWQVAAPLRTDPALTKDQDAQRMTQAVMNIFDAAIRAAPEQFFWYNKRWVLDPLEELPMAPKQAGKVTP